MILRLAGGFNMAAHPALAGTAKLPWIPLKAPLEYRHVDGLD